MKATAVCYQAKLAGGGGGGGSSFVIPIATSTSSGLSNRTASSQGGQVMITYEPMNDSCPSPLVASPTFTG
jgi:hypothetical protein